MELKPCTELTLSTAAKSTLKPLRAFLQLTKNDFCALSAAVNLPSVGSTIKFQFSNSSALRLDSTKARIWGDARTNRFNASSISIKWPM